MMVSPNGFRKLHENDSIEKLKEVRDGLIHAIWNYESGNISEEAKMRCPSPGTVYSCNKEYLMTVLDMIEEKILLKKVFQNPGVAEEQLIRVKRSIGKKNGLSEEQASRMEEWLIDHGHTRDEINDAIAYTMGLNYKEEE